MLSKGYSLPASLYGQTTSSTVPAWLYQLAMPKSQNIGVDKNLGARQDFIAFHQFPEVYISASRHPIKKP